MVAAALSGWLAGTVLRDFDGSVAGLRFGPIDTIIAVAGLCILLSGLYARGALPDAETAEDGGPAGGPAGKEEAGKEEAGKPAGPADEATAKAAAAGTPAPPRRGSTE